MPTRLLATIALTVLVAAACTTPAKTRFYALAPTQTQPVEGLTEKASNLIIGLGPVTVPPYLDRPQIVTRTSQNQVDLADVDNWAESLDTMIPRVLAQDLSALLDTDRIYQMPQRRDVQLYYQAEIDIVQFDADASGDVLLDATWRLYGWSGDRLLVERRSEITRPHAGDGRFEGVAGAMSAALGDLAREIATEIAKRGR